MACRRSITWAAVPAACLILAGGLIATARAGPPFFTDDPEPVDFGHYELYLFSSFDKTRNATAVGAPSLEFNTGVAPDTQLHAILPFMSVRPTGGPDAFGPGDLELGVKYRLINNEEEKFMVGTFPLLECPTGDRQRGLGNGRTWGKLPIWVQKSWGPWTTYGGGGYAINRGPGQRDFGFGGWLLQRDINEKLTLGAELYGEGPSTDSGRGFLLYNIGGTIKCTDHFNILVTAGHTLAGEQHMVGYVAMYWTW
jgi:hypothetical protein